MANGNNGHKNRNLARVSNANAAAELRELYTARAHERANNADSSAAVDHTNLVTQTLLALLAPCDGWLRIVPDESGVVYWKFKFTCSAWPNHYVMFVQRPYDDVWLAVNKLLDKVERVRAGIDNPVGDRYYK